MIVTIDISDEVAARIEERGLTPERYLQDLLNRQGSATSCVVKPRAITDEEFEASLHRMAEYSHKIPVLPDEALTREGIYQDHD